MVSSSASSLIELTQAVSHFAEISGDHVSILPQLSFHRRISPKETTHCIYNLGVGIILQGEKQVIIGDQIHLCAEAQSMLTTIDLPVTSNIVQASAQKPFLAVLLLLDLQMVHQVIADLPAQLFHGSDDVHPAFTVASVDAPLTDAFLRLVKLLDEPDMIAHLAPLIEKEIIVRVLNGPHGIYLRQLLKTGSSNHKIQHVVNWLKHHYVQPIRIDDLANQAFMSPSSFRQHFRDVTGMSPLQYQKQLRLQEARQLMLNQRVDAGRAAGMVGYESASQFSREYSRLFGESPQRDILKVRQSLS